MCVCVFVFVFVFVCVCVCMSVCGVGGWVHACIHTYIHTYLRVTAVEVCGCRRRLLARSFVKLAACLCMDGCEYVSKGTLACQTSTRARTQTL